jgi:hypothetical protein
MYDLSGELTTGHSLVIAKVWERLAVSKQAAQKFDMERFTFRKLFELEVRKQYQIKISNRFAAFENLSDSEDINRAWENMKEDIKTSSKESLGLYELKQHKPWLDEEFLGFLDETKQAKMELLQGPNHRNIDNLNNVRREVCRHFRNKKEEYMKAKTD